MLTARKLSLHIDNPDIKSIKFDRNALNTFLLAALFEHMNIFSVHSNPVPITSS